MLGAPRRAHNSRSQLRRRRSPPRDAVAVSAAITVIATAALHALLASELERSEPRLAPEAAGRRSDPPSTLSGRQRPVSEEQATRAAASGRSLLYRAPSPRLRRNGQGFRGSDSRSLLCRCDRRSSSLQAPE